MVLDSIQPVPGGESVSSKARGNAIIMQALEPITSLFEMIILVGLAHPGPAARGPPSSVGSSVSGSVGSESGKGQ